MTLNRHLVIGGASIGNYWLVRNVIFDDDYIIFCASELHHLDKLHIKPCFIIGDSDFQGNPQFDI